MRGNDHVHDALVDAHEAYLAANTVIDPIALRKVWDSDPSNVWFNLSGHSYQGLDHWCKLWDYYSTRIRSVEPWKAVDLDVRSYGDAGWVTATRQSELSWIGDGPPPMKLGRGQSRSTMIFLRQDGVWKAVHAHFSPVNEAPRPGEI